MVNNCCVIGCKNIWQPNSNITYHKFPLKDEARFAQWMSIKQLRNVKVTPTKRICSAHFTAQSFEEHSAVKRLKKDAVPSIFGETFYGDNILRKAVYTLKEVCIDNKHEKSTNIPSKVTEADLQETPVLNIKYDHSSTSIEKNLNGSIQTSSKYFENRKEILYLRNKIKMLQQQLRRRNSKIANMQKIIHYLKKTDLNKKNVHKVSRTNFNWKEHSYCFRIT